MASGLMVGVCLYIKPFETIRIIGPVIFYLISRQGRDFVMRVMIICCLGTFLCLTMTSWIIHGYSFDYIYPAYLKEEMFINLRPNLGLFWYFFTEVIMNGLHYSLKKIGLRCSVDINHFLSWLYSWWDLYSWSHSTNLLNIIIFSDLSPSFMLFLEWAYL